MDKERNIDIYEKEEKFGLLFLMDKSNNYRNKNNFVLLSERRRVVEILHEVLMEIYRDDDKNGKEKDEEVLKVLDFFHNKYDMELISSELIKKTYDAEMQGFRYVLMYTDEKQRDTVTYPCMTFLADY